MSQILGKERRLTQGFLQLKSHYLFQHHFCRVARGNEKGVVEGQVKFTRLNYFVPVPQVRDLAQLNPDLRQRCAADQQRRLRGQPGPRAQLLAEDQKTFGVRGLPEVFDAKWRSMPGSPLRSLPDRAGVIRSAARQLIRDAAARDRERASVDPSHSKSAENRSSAVRRWPWRVRNSHAGRNQSTGCNPKS